MNNAPENDALPQKLTNDAILEAVLDIRFEYDSKRVSEVFFGQIALMPEWKGFTQARSAVADIPESIRRTQSDLRYQSAFQLTGPDGRIAVQVGPQVFVYSRRGAYPGWDEAFWPELEMAIDHLFNVVPNLSITRLGLRYINALRSDLHEIKSVIDLNLGITVAGEPIENNLNVNYVTRVGSPFETVTRIASVDRAQGQVPENTTVIVDIDVYTPSGFETRIADSVKDWVDEAHKKEKESFFSILGKDVTNRLREI
ncbi:TIGR04255 family protein [Novosphingobium sp. ZN18A2]|uniref:TIGR04255 family protein n=1 Tax=Novosphingobium sp. ZN18A2 TaxID=3079861 RepID=UPI0030CC1713